MPSTATTVACEVSKFSLGVGLHVTTSQSTFASIEGDFRFDEVNGLFADIQLIRDPLVYISVYNTITCGLCPAAPYISGTPTVRYEAKS